MFTPFHLPELESPPFAGVEVVVDVEDHHITNPGKRVGPVVPKP